MDTEDVITILSIGISLIGLAFLLSGISTLSWSSMAGGSITLVVGLALLAIIRRTKG